MRLKVKENGTKLSRRSSCEHPLLSTIRKTKEKWFLLAVFVAFQLLLPLVFFFKGKSQLFTF